jgi:hypothetical protein
MIGVIYCSEYRRGGGGYIDHANDLLKANRVLNYSEKLLKENL